MGKYKWTQITNVPDLLQKKSSVMINSFWTALNTIFGSVEELGMVILFNTNHNFYIQWNPWHNILD
jgi:hypothetical protein